MTLDYEIFNLEGPGPVREHVEHTVIARAHGDTTMMVIADTHAGAAVVLRETSPGVFGPGPDGSPYPMKVVVSVLEPGRVDHQWWYGSKEDGASPKDLAVLTLIG